MIKKIKQLFNKLFKKPYEIPYCKNCQYWIEFSSEIKSISGRENEDGQNICGFSINTKPNYIGYETMVTQNDIIHCSECGSILRDERTPIYRKCASKNRLKNCKDFLKITKFQLLKKNLKSIIIKVKNMLKSFNVSKSYLLLGWFIFNIIFLIQNDVFLDMTNKNVFYYILITLVAFGVSMRK